MGYSARADAFDTLRAIERSQKALGCASSNGIVKDGQVIGFYEIGRENRDGAITGQVFKNCEPYHVGQRGPDRAYATKAGSFRISPDGVVERFPLLGKKKVCVHCGELQEKLNERECAHCGFVHGLRSL